MPNEQGTKPLSLPLKLLATILLTFLYGIFLLDSHWGLGFTIVNLTLIGLLLFIKPEVANKESLFYLASSAILSLFIPFRAYHLGTALTFFVAFILNALAVSRANSPKSETLTLKSLILIPIQVGFFSFTQLIFWISYLKNSLTGQKTSSEITQKNLISGILLAIPLLIVFTILLTTADPIFAKHLDTILSKFNINIFNIKRIIEITLFFGIFSALLSNKYEYYKEFILLLENHRIQKEIAVASTFLTLLLGAFLIVQGQFLFAGEKLLKDAGIMLSDYTRNGYTQLLIVSTLSLGLISILTNRSGNKNSTFIKSITLIFLAEVFLLLVSASYRVYLYQDAHGFTEIRLLGILFSIWLSVALFVFLYRFFSKLEIPLFSYLFTAAIGTIFLMHLINIDYTIAVIKKPNLGYGIDYPYILTRSTDAWPAWEESLKNLETFHECSQHELDATFHLFLQHLDLNSRAENNWHNYGAWSKSDSEALNFLNKNQTRIDKLSQRYNDCINQPQIEHTDTIVPTPTPEVQIQMEPAPSPVMQESHPL